MRSRFNLFRFRYNNIERMAKRRLGKQPDEKKLNVASILTFLGGMLLCDCFFVEDIIVSVEVDAAIAFVLLTFGAFLNLRRLAPRPCWWRTMRTGFVGGALWTLTTWVCYFADALTLNQALMLSIEAVIFFVIAIIALFRWRYIRCRSQATIALMRMRRRRQRSEVM